MGLFSDLLSATVKTVLTPVAVVHDAASLAITGEVGNSTKKLVESVKDDLSEAVDNLADGDLV